MNENGEHQDDYISLLPEDYVVKMTPTEFELSIKSHIAELGASLPKFNVFHNVNLIADDGAYQIDVYAVYEALGVEK